MRVCVTTYCHVGPTLLCSRAVLACMTYSGSGAQSGAS